MKSTLSGLKPASDPVCDCDVLIIGSGPAGLATAINSASEGLSVLILEANSELGGQAGSSTMIENYPGFPEGLTGADLMSRAVQQAAKFGANVMCPETVTDIQARDETHLLVTTESNSSLVTPCVILATGVSYKRLKVTNLGYFMGTGVSYGLPPSVRLQNHGAKRHYVVGAANSAGQAALHLAQNPRADVTILARGHSWTDKMSDYLVKRVETAQNIKVVTHTEVIGVEGKQMLEKLVLRTQRGDEVSETTVDANYLSIFIGAEPKTNWLESTVLRDEKGFVMTGRDIPLPMEKWHLDRKPFTFETCLPGLFAVGDVRFRSTKRVAAAIGEGSAVVPSIHQYMALIRK